MALSHLIAASLAVRLAAGYLVAPPGVAWPGAASDCSGWVEGQNGLTCSAVEGALGISAADFESWNPGVASGTTCQLSSSFDYCIQVNYGSTTTSPTSTSMPSTTSSSTSTTTTGDGISTPSPIQTGMVSNCDKFYLVQSGDTCAAIAAAAGISLSTFYSWNPAVGTSCAYLGLGDYVCIDILGYSTTSVSTTTTGPTTPADGISTPSPIQTGMVSTCDKFYLVQSGDTCAAIAAAAGISLNTFYAWNPAVGTSCAYLGLGDYVCIDILGYSTTLVTTTTPTTPADGISTPSPIQTGMVSTCDKFYLVQSGDTCAAIAAAAGIPLDTFYSWNPAVGDNCAYLDLGDYVCTDIIGYVPSTTTTPPATTTSSGDGITTPTPYEPGMVSNCAVFHLVASGDSCASIAALWGVTAADIEEWNPQVGSSCTGLWLGYYVCTGVLYGA